MTINAAEESPVEQESDSEFLSTQDSFYSTEPRPELPSAEQMLSDILQLRGWDRREGQVIMVEEIGETITEGEDIITSAPVGIGKSLGYLLPIIASGQRGVVSTSTIALQDQLITSELPDLARDLEELYGFKLRYTQIKGKGHYLCHDAANSMLSGTAQEDDVLDLGSIDPDNMDVLKEELERTRQAMEDGDVLAADSLDFMRKIGGIRSKIRANKCVAHGGSWNKMLEYDEEKGAPGDLIDIYDSRTCPYGKIYARAVLSDIVVINTSLLAAETKKAGLPIPVASQLKGTGIVVVDEAHHLVDKLIDSMRVDLDFHPISDSLSTYIRRIGKRYPKSEQSGTDMYRQFRGMHSQIVEIIDDDEEDSEEGEIEFRDKMSTALWRCFGIVKGYITRIREGLPFEVENIEDQHRGVEIIEKICDSIQTDVCEPLAEAAKAIDSESQDSTEDEVDYGYSLSFSGGDEGSDLLIEMIPVDVSFYRSMLESVCKGENDHMQSIPQLRKYFQRPTMIMCSGTLTEESGYAVGMSSDHCSYIQVESPFDPQHTRIYVPTHISLPNEDEWEDEAWEEALHGISAVGGRTLFLTTSADRMKNFKERALHQYGDRFQILWQGNGMNRTQVLREFAEDEHSLMFGTVSYWEGVNIPGSALSHVVIDRVKFPQPTDPVFRARREWMERHGRNPFMDVDVDHASIMMAQGIGRLIRSQTDLGGITILDPRVETKRYAKSLMKLVPGSTLVTVYPEEFERWMSWVNPDNDSGDDLPSAPAEYWRELRPVPKRRRRKRS